MPYIHQRKQFNQPIADFQMVQQKTADMFTRLSSSRALLYGIYSFPLIILGVATACDNGDVRGDECAGVILYTAEAATKSALDAIQLLGGNGYTNEYDAGRLLRDAKLYEIGAGTSEVRRLIIARSIAKEFKD